MKHLFLVTVVFGIALWGLPVLAKTPQPADESDKEPPLVLKVYTVSDIQLEMSKPSRGIDDLDAFRPDLSIDPFPHQVPLQGSLALPIGSNSRTSKRNGCVVWEDSSDSDRLREAIDDLILGSESVEKGGQSDIKILGDALVVSATEKNHQKIAAFLDALRQQMTTRKMVAVEVHWLWLTEKQLNSLVPCPMGDRRTIRRTVDEAAWQRLAQDRAREDSDQRSGYHAAATCMNGQTVLATGGRESRFISTLIPVVGDATPPAVPATSSSLPQNHLPSVVSSSPAPSTVGVGYQPVITTIQEGAAVQLRPMLCAGSQVLLEIRARAVEIQQQEGSSASAARRPANFRADSQAAAVRELASAVERPLVLNHRLDTTLRLPLGRRVLAGGITRSEHPEPGEPNLYVFVEASIFDPQSAVTTPKQK
jgi:hypothetical protein